MPTMNLTEAEAQWVESMRAQKNAAAVQLPDVDGGYWRFVVEPGEQTVEKVATVDTVSEVSARTEPV